MKEEPICKVSEDGTKKWYLNDKLHREDGPALEFTNGVKEWWQNGELYRENGPSIEWPDGFKEWFTNGERLTEKEFNKAMNEKGKEVLVIF